MASKRYDVGWAELMLSPTYELGSMMILRLIAIFIFLLHGVLFAATERIPQFANEKVSVWETVIYPSVSQVLKMHRHEHDRVVVAFNDGILKVTNNKGQTHYLKFQKNKACYLLKDIPGEMHTDENITHHPIKVLVIELRT